MSLVSLLEKELRQAAADLPSDAGAQNDFGRGY